MKVGDEGLEAPEDDEGGVRQRLWRIIFLSDTPAGRAFDVALLVLISTSVLVVMVESVPSIAAEYASPLRITEWVFTGIFTAEFLTRLAITRRPSRYLFSFFGIVDVLSILPSYLELFFDDTHFLMTVRVFRLLRMFRVLKMAHHLGEIGTLVSALQASRRKIAVFLFSVMALVCVEGTVVYVVERGVNPAFDSIPQSMYWAVVTLTTVGYGDVTPVTVLGKLIASVIMLTGFAIIAVPTGVVTAELGRQMRDDGRTCSECGWRGHDPRALFCHHCGQRLPS
jgi:voltage-gated potassium channel